MSVQKICELCGKVISFSGFVQATALHDADGRFACLRCRRDEKPRLDVRAIGTRKGDAVA